MGERLETDYVATLRLPLDGIHITLDC